PSYWMEKAAKQDHTGAQATLAYYYLHGAYDIEQDNVQAWAWAKRAFTNDSSYKGEKFSDFMQNKTLADEILIQSKEQMNAEERTRAKKLSSDLRKKYAKNITNPQIEKDIVVTSIKVFILWKLGGRIFGNKTLRNLKRDYRATLRSNKKNFKNKSELNARNQAAKTEYNTVVKNLNTRLREKRRAKADTKKTTKRRAVVAVNKARAEVKRAKAALVAVKRGNMKGNVRKVALDKAKAELKRAKTALKRARAALDNPKSKTLGAGSERFRQGVRTREQGSAISKKGAQINKEGAQMNNIDGLKLQLQGHGQQLKGMDQQLKGTGQMIKGSVSK
ncbi:MAG: hypothetical protein ACR2M7_01510, partial [Bdellovibrionales bacterium]